MTRTDLFYISIILMSIGGMLKTWQRKRAGLPSPPINVKARFVVSILGLVTILGIGATVLAAFHHANHPIPDDLVAAFMISFAVAVTTCVVCGRKLIV